MYYSIRFSASFGIAKKKKVAVMCFAHRDHILASCMFRFFLVKIEKKIKKDLKRKSMKEIE